MDPSQTTKLKQIFQKDFYKNITTFIKWLILSIITGLIVGSISTLFARSLGFVTSFRERNPWCFLLLPVMGLIIVFLYQKIGINDRGANQVLSTVRSQDDIPMYCAPLIFISTILTHFAGGSAGREGAAIQLGGCIGNQIGRWIHLDEEDKHIIVMCGMCAAFSAVFGTPMAAAVFAMEVISVGVMYYAALFPCVIASLIASNFSANLGVHPEAFPVIGIPEFTLVNAGKIGLVAIGCGAISVVFCILLTQIGKFYERKLPNPYIRILAASAVIIFLTFLLQTSDYMGSGTVLIVQAIEHGKIHPLSFLFKMILTALTMKAGFRGGEIVPAFSIGASFGCVMGQLLGISPSVCAAAGMAAVFCGVTNCPVTSILIAFEMFGFEGSSYYLIAVAVSYAMSGYYGLYKDQTIVYSKYKAKYINRHTKH